MAGHPGKYLTQDWLESSRKRLEIARQIRYSNPRQTLEILLALFDELFQRMENETKTI
jgi:hypothetical protein